MKVDVDYINESKNGWNVRLNVNLSPEELSRLNHEAIDMVEDFDINIEGPNLYFNCFLDLREPWEDEPLEELLKALKLEVKYHTQNLLK